MKERKKLLYKAIDLKYKLQTWNDKFDLPDGSQTVSDTQECFEYYKTKMYKYLIIPQ